MIVSFFATGKGKGDSAINYLLSSKDADGKERIPKPEVFMGDKDITKALINNNTNECKYSSGVFAFRDNENPTDDQLRGIVKEFYKTFCPGLTTKNINFFAVKHQDKGNLELHFIIPRVELTTHKAFNVAPPGKPTQELTRDFQAVINHKLGYLQIVEDPLKSIFSDFDKKVPASAERGRKKEKVSYIISRMIKTGHLNTREDLIKYLEKKDAVITRRGKDYLSIKFKGEKKAMRFTGPAFHAKVNYKELAEFADQKMKSPIFLNPQNLEKIEKRMEKNIQYRLQFNQNRYTIKKRVSRFNTKPVIKPSPSKDDVKLNIAPNIMKILNEMRVTNQQMKDSFKKSLNTTFETPQSFSESLSATSEPTSSDVGSSFGTVQSLLSSLGNIQAKIAGLNAKLGFKTSLIEEITIRQQLAELRIQEEKLGYEIQAAQNKSLENNPFYLKISKPKPPWG